MCPLKELLPGAHPSRWKLTYFFRDGLWKNKSGVMFGTLPFIDYLGRSVERNLRVEGLASG